MATVTRERERAEVVERYRPLVTYLVNEAALSAGFPVDETSLQRVGEDALSEAVARAGSTADAALAAVLTPPVRSALRIAAAAQRPDATVRPDEAELITGLDEVTSPEAVGAALDRLPGVLAELLRSLYLEQRDVEQTARQLGIPPEHLVERRSDALRQLGAALGAARGAAAVMAAPFSRNLYT